MDSGCSSVAWNRQYKLDLLGTTSPRIDRWSSKTQIIDRTTGEPRVCDLRFLTLADLDELLDLQARVAAELTDPTLFRTVAAERHRLFLSGRGCTSGAFVDGRLIGYAASQFPVADTDNQGLAIGLSAVDAARVCQMEGIVVDSAFRGQRLARILNEMRSARAVAHGFSIIVATISPFNGSSLASFLPIGWFVRGIREGAGSLLRYYVSDDLSADLVRTSNDTIVVPSADIEAQKQLIAEGWWGYEPIRDGAHILMRFGRFRHIDSRQFHAVEPPRPAAATDGEQAAGGIDLLFSAHGLGFSSV